MAKSKKMEKMSVLSEFFENPDDVYITPNLSRDNIEQIIERTKSVDLPIKLKPTTSSKKKVEPNISQSKVKVEPQVQPKLSHHLSQSSAKVEPKTDFQELVGLQRNTLIHLFEMCVQAGSRITPPVAISNLAESLGTTVSAGRKAIQRLEEKAFVIRNKFKDGRGGWTKYEIKEEVYKTLLLASRNQKVEPNISQSRAKVRTQLEPQLEPNLSNSSENNIDNSSLLSQEIQIPAGLKTVISKKEISELLNNGHLTEIELRESLEHFAYDLENGLVKSKSHPVNLFFGLSRSGKKYRSLSLLERQTAELREYQKDLMKLEYEEKQLKEAALKMKFREFIGKNPNYLEEVKAANPMASAPEVIEQIAFSKWSEQQ